MSRATEQADQRLDELIVLTERLTALIKCESVSLKTRRPHELKDMVTLKAELSGHYARAMAKLRQDADGIKAASPERRRRLTNVTEAFRAALEELSNMLARMRRISEGIVRAIAEEATQMRPKPVGYGQNAGPAGPAPTPAALAVDRIV